MPFASNRSPHASRPKSRCDLSLAKKQRDPVAKNSVEKVISSALEGIARAVDRENRALEPSSRLFETLRAARGPITSEQITFSTPFLATARRFFFLDCTQRPQPTPMSKQLGTRPLHERQIMVKIHHDLPLM